MEIVMGSYIQGNLVPGEQVQYVAKISKWALLPRLVLGVCLLPAYGIGILFLISAAITYYTTELAITNRRVIAKFGFIKRQTVEMSIPKIESIQVDQGILGRIFGFGSVLVSGGGNPQAPIPNISDPVQFRNSFFAVQG